MTTEDATAPPDDCGCPPRLHWSSCAGEYAGMKIIENPAVPPGEIHARPAAPAPVEVAPDLTRTELRRIAEEFKSERDAAKRDAMRAFDERNVLLAENARLAAEKADFHMAYRMKCDEQTKAAEARAEAAERDARKWKGLYEVADGARCMALSELAARAPKE
jgi:hypothetical protein